jgi:hypothetical protein
MLPLLLVAVALRPLVIRALRGPLHDRDFDWSYLELSRWSALLSHLVEVWRPILVEDALPIAEHS